MCYYAKGGSAVNGAASYSFKSVSIQGNMFTESAPRPIQYICHVVCLYVVRPLRETLLPD